MPLPPLLQATNLGRLGSASAKDTNDSALFMESDTGACKGGGTWHQEGLEVCRKRGEGLLWRVGLGVWNRILNTRLYAKHHSHPPHSPTPAGALTHNPRFLNFMAVVGAGVAAAGELTATRVPCALALPCDPAMMCPGALHPLGGAAARHPGHASHAAGRARGALGRARRGVPRGAPEPAAQNKRARTRGGGGGNLVLEHGGGYKPKKNFER